MNILLLGATGYLGGNIARYLTGTGNRVICVVRRTSNVKIIEKYNCELVSNEFGQIELIFKTNDIDWVINAITTYKPNNSLYEDVFESNLFYPLRVINTAIKHGTKNYMTMGTGLPDKLNVYSFSKARLSDFGRYLSEIDKINFLDLRLEMFYGGDNEPDNRFIRSCILKMMRNERLDLTEGLQKRDIVRVEDILPIIKYLLNNNYVNGYKTLPIGTGECHAIRAIIEHIAGVIGSDSELRFGAIENRIGEPDTVADVSWYEEIGFKPRYTFFEGLNDICSKYANEQ